MYLTYNQWSGKIITPFCEYEEGCFEVSDKELNNLTSPIFRYIVHNNKLIKKDNILRLNFENVETEIPYNFEKSELKLIIDKKEKYLKFKVNISIGKYIDMSVADTLEVDNPLIDIFVYDEHELIDTLVLNLNTYFRKGFYEVDISHILDNRHLSTLMFKTKRCFETCSYQIVEPNFFFDRNLEITNSHINFTQTSKNKLEITHNINYWNEFEDIIGAKIVAGFVENNDPNRLEYFVVFNLKTLKDRNTLEFFIPDNVLLEDKNIFHKFDKLKIKYENTHN